MVHFCWWPACFFSLCFNSYCCLVQPFLLVRFRLLNMKIAVKCRTHAFKICFTIGIRTRYIAYTCQMMSLAILGQINGHDELKLNPTHQQGNNNVHNQVKLLFVPILYWHNHLQLWVWENLHIKYITLVWFLIKHKTIIVSPIYLYYCTTILFSCYSGQYIPKMRLKGKRIWTLFVWMKISFH